MEQNVFFALDKDSTVATYTPEPFAIPYIHEGRRHSYIPDILVEYTNGSKEVIEVKPIYEVGLPVGSRTGARTLGSGGFPTAFAVARSPAAIVTFPVPASLNAACGFPALRFPACFASGL